MKTYYTSAGFNGRQVVGFGDSSIGVFLGVQDTKYYIVNYCISWTIQGNGSKPYLKTSCLGLGLQDAKEAANKKIQLMTLE